MVVSLVSAEGSYQYRFFADVMLGTLARWLRIIGYDTSYEKSVDDDELIQFCLSEGRVALTRDRRLAERKKLKDCLLIEGNTLVEQLREVIRFTECPVNLGLLLSRCLACNSAIENIEKDIIPFCRQKCIGVIGYMALMQGILTGKYNGPEDVPSPQAHSRHFHHSRGKEYSRHGEEEPGQFD